MRMEVSTKVTLSRVSSRISANFGGNLIKMVQDTPTRATGQTEKWMALVNSNTVMDKSWKEHLSTTCYRLRRVARNTSYALLRPRVSTKRSFQRLLVPFNTRRKRNKKKVKLSMFTRPKISMNSKIFFWTSKNLEEQPYSLVPMNQISGLKTCTTSSRTMVARGISKPYIWEILPLRLRKSHMMKESSMLKTSTNLAQTCYTIWSLVRDQVRFSWTLMRTVTKTKVMSNMN